mgnify:CR=1 FL=1
MKDVPQNELLSAYLDGELALDDALRFERRLAEEPELREALEERYLAYALSTIMGRALPDARDGLKPSQRRILVAMNDLNLSPGAARVKCAKISGDTSGNRMASSSKFRHSAWHESGFRPTGQR